MSENLSREEKIKKLKAIRESEKNKSITNVLSSLDDLDNYLSKYNDIDNMNEEVKNEEVKNEEVKNEEVKNEEVKNEIVNSKNEKKIKGLISFFEKK